MIGWIILAVLVGLIVLVMLVPIGADIRYEDEVIRISAKAAGIKLQLIPKPKREPKAEKHKKEKPKKEKKPKPEKEKKEPEKKKKSLPFNAEEILELLKIVLGGFGRFGRKFKIERFVLHWIAAGWDPYITARTFSLVNAGLSQLAPICTERFHCRDSSVWTDIDFVRENMFLEFGLTTTIRIGQILGVGFSIGFGAVKVLIRSKLRAKREAKEEAAALKKWLREHPDEAAVYEAERQAEEQAKKQTEELATQVQHQDEQQETELSA